MLNLCCYSTSTFLSGLLQWLHSIPHLDCSVWILYQKFSAEVCLFSGLFSSCSPAAFSHSPSMMPTTSSHSPSEMPAYL